MGFVFRYDPAHCGRYRSSQWHDQDGLANGIPGGLGLIELASAAPPAPSAPHALGQTGKNNCRDREKRLTLITTPFLLDQIP